MIYERLCVLVGVAFYARVQGSPLPASDHNGKNEAARLGITISPIMSWRIIREIGIYWDITDLREGDQVVVYDGEPEVNGTKAIYAVEPSETRGFAKTKVRAKFVPTEELTFRDRCLNYYAAWVRNGVIQKVTCLATHPNWMRQRKTTLGSKRLNEIFIPGTHDSGAYNKREEPKFESVVDKYTITQDEDVLSQLIYGVRYLDIRVGRYPGTGSLWWANHGYFSIHPLRTIIEDVKTFLDNTEEIVIFDVQEFPVGFDRDAAAKHTELVAYLENQFAGYYLPKTGKDWGMSLDEIWATGKRLIIGYDNNKVYPRHGSTWPPVTHRWPRVKKLNDLYSKIMRFEDGSDPVEHFSLRDHPPSSVMAQLTPEALDALLDFLGGLRKMAELVNMNITDSYNDKWRCTANIVSMDYIKSSGIIETALEWNDRRPEVC